MTLYFRLLWLLIRYRWRPRIGLLESSRLGFRVLPLDVDINSHLTNARYLSFMDLGRTDLIIATGMLGKLLRRRWLPVVAIANLRFRRSIEPFERISLETKLIGWDEKWFYIEQRFVTRKGICAVGLVKGLFLGPKGKVPSVDLLTLAGIDDTTPQIPEVVRRMNAFDRALDQEVKAQAA